VTEHHSNDPLNNIERDGRGVAVCLSKGAEGRVA
jgi:hypothetical protein